MAQAVLKLVNPVRREKPENYFQDLAFVDSSADKRVFWSPPDFKGDPREPRNWRRANILGNGFAEATILEIRKTSFVPALGWIAGAQVAARAYDGITVGFWSRIARELL